MEKVGMLLMTLSWLCKSTRLSLLVTIHYEKFIIFVLTLVSTIFLIEIKKHAQGDKVIIPP